MIERVITRRSAGFDETAEKRDYWLGRTPAERVEHVEQLRREYWGEDYGDRLRLRRTADAVKRIRR